MKTLPTALTVAKWTAILGLACGVVYSIGGFFVDLFTIGLNAGTAMAFGALIGMPLMFGALGFACGALAALTVQGLHALRR